MNRSPGVQRFANLWGTPRSFRTSEKNKTVPFAGSPRFSKPRISSHKLQLPTNIIKTFPKGASRFCKPRISAQNYKFAQAQLNPLPLRVLFRRPVSLKHGRLAHVRSQFSLFRRSPTHKNLPLATFCTSERHSRRPCRLFVLPAAAIFSALRQCPCRDSTLRVHFAAASRLAQLFDAKS